MHASSRWFALIVASVLVCGCGPRTTGDPVQIGQLIPLTGVDRVQGESARDGAILALEQAVEEDKRAGTRPFVVRHVDTRGEPSAAEAEAVRLLSVNRVSALVGSLEYATSERLVRAVQSYSAPLVLPGELPTTPPEGVICLGVGPARRGEVLARYAVQERKATRAAILTDPRQSIPATLANAFATEWRKGSTNIDETTFTTDEQLRAAARRVAEAKPDVVLVAVNGADFAKVRKALDEAGVKASLLFGGEDAGPAVTPGGDNPGEVIVATVFAPAAYSDRGKDFARRYEEKYRVPPDFHAAQSYDAVRLLIDTMAKAKTAITTRIRDDLAAVENFDSVTGPLSLKDRKTKRSVFVVQLGGDGPKLAWTAAPDS